MIDSDFFCDDPREAIAAADLFATASGMREYIRALARKTTNVTPEEFLREFSLA